MSTSSGSRLFFVFFLVLFLLVGVGGNRWLLAAELTPADEVAAPRLVVVLVIDQFRADYLVRFRDRFGPDGFNRLLRQGANFVFCFYPYAHTVTAAGHATLATGTTPDRHGITGNEWYDAQRGRMAQAVEDEAFPVVGTTSNLPGVSPHNLVGTTLADQLRLATGDEAKVFGVAIKDRSVIFSIGRRASGAYWYDYQTGHFITSRYYREVLPDWVVTFNQQRMADGFYGKDWEVNGRVSVPMTTEAGHPDAGYYSRLRRTPYGNEIVAAFARELVEQEGLGEDEVPDFLFVGFSSNDFVGHRWGPYSDEVAAMTLQTDAQVAELLAFLDQCVEMRNYWLVLSADHGVAPTLAQARARGLPATGFDSSAVLRTVEKAFDERWGEDDWLVPKAGLVFNRGTLRKRGVGLGEAAHLAGRAALEVNGILGYVAGEEARLDAAMTRAVRLSLYRGRSPDAYVVREPLALSDGDASHGTPHAYDTHVPLIFLGAPFRPGSYREQVSTTDLAPTLAAALGITPPARATGKVLEQALRVADASAGRRR